MFFTDTHGVQAMSETRSPATLVAILVAARRSGDRELEHQIRQRLLDEHGIKVTFVTRREEGGRDA